MNDVMTVHNPADVQEVVGSRIATDVSEVDALVEAASRAQPAWAALTPSHRADLIDAAVAELDPGSLAELITREVGKPLADSDREIRYLSASIDGLRPHLEWLADGEDLGSSGTHVTRVGRAPFGVVGVIGAWNSPVGMSMVNIAPALVAGNSVVLHIPPTAPLAAEQALSRVASALPAAVLTLVTSTDTRVAQALVEHRLVRHVHFTGSCAVGRLVASEAAASLTTLTLELGGNDPAILLDDATEVPQLFESLAHASLLNGGQACIAMKRIYVPRAHVGHVVDGLREQYGAHRIGDPREPTTTLGPLHTARQRQWVRSLLEDARERGGEVWEGGHVDTDLDRGHYMLPSIVTGIDNGAALVREEQFGPAVPVVAYDDVEEALRMANDTDFGLAASVWSRDIERAEAIASRIEAGMVAINAHGSAAVDARAPFGGVKSSGIGRGGSNRYGLETFTEPRAVIRRTS